VIYRIKEHQIELLSLAVDEKQRRTGVATSLLRRVMAKLSATQKKIKTRVSDICLDGQLFLRELGFVCVGIDKKAEEGCLREEYRMVFRWEWVGCNG
jgi:N-acetylglutamate synthase-like GNAT family acetyltransferase